MLPIRERIDPKFLFMGAGNRFELLSGFKSTLESIGFTAEFSSIELDEGVPPPIADLAQITYAPEFGVGGFGDWFTDFLGSRRFDFVIPCMDSAFRSISRKELLKFGTNFAPGEDSGKFTDKKFLVQRVADLGLPYLDFTGNTEKVIVKHRYGFGSRNQQILSVEDERLGYLLDDESLVVQDFLEGRETSVDIYVDKAGGLHMISRDRIKVVSGEVMITSTRTPTNIERYICETLVAGTDLVGPLNVQLIGENSNVMDFNPRFGGGATASIKAGWRADLWLIQEYYLGESIPPVHEFTNLTITRSRKDHVR